MSKTQKQARKIGRAEKNRERELQELFLAAQGKNHD
jgi:hypothetical protein